MQVKRFWVVGQSVVAAVSERRNSSRMRDRRSETAATKINLTNYRFWGSSVEAKVAVVVHRLEGDRSGGICGWVSLPSGLAGRRSENSEGTFFSVET
jgi:hypothetical protein